MDKTASKMAALDILLLATGILSFVDMFENVLIRSLTDAADVGSVPNSKFYTAKEIVWRS